MKAVSLTARISLLFAVAAALVLLATGLLLSRAVERHFVEEDRHEMLGKIELVAHLLAKVRGRAALDALPQQLDDALVGHHGLSLSVVDGAGAIWFASSGAAFPHALLTHPTGDNPALRQWTQGGVDYRGMVVSVPAGAPAGGAYTVAVALDITHHQVFLAQFRRMLFWAMGLAALATAALGWIVVRRGLRPLGQVTAMAASISASRLAERLDTRHVPAELRELVAAFNAMLARLEDGFRRLADFSSDIAHELRTPVSNLLTQTQVALSRARDAAAYRDILQSNLEEFEGLGRMIGDMLFLAKADNRLIVPQRQDLELGQEIGRLLEFHEALAADRGVLLVGSGSARVSGDQRMLQRAVSNLLSNAIRHTPRGGTVTVNVAAEAGGARIAVENPGPAIPAEHLPRLFDRFYRGDPARQRQDEEGTGLGLAIALSIAQAHGGGIQVESADARTCFTLWLPPAARA